MQKINIFLLFLFLCNPLALFCLPSTQPTYHLTQTLLNSHMRKSFASFIDTILRQVPSDTFYSLVDSVVPSNSTKYNDEDFYRLLLESIPTIIPKNQFYYQFKTLQNQKKELTGQIKTLLSSTNHIDTILEIGTPATYASSIAHNISTDKIYAVHDKKRLTDIIQSFSFNPFKKFVKYDASIEINDYAPLSDHIESNSIDVVICVIGLHHIPKEKLNAFIESIRRVLKPEGVFILRDHDITSPELNALVHCAHSVFNLLMNQDILATEIAEYRNFQALDYWIDLVEQHGFKVSTERLLQENDPTLNTMTKFTKIAHNESEREEVISSRLHKKQDYKRDVTQTYLTSPEWFSVDMAQDYGRFIEHTPFYEYPYFTTVKAYWSIFLNSWKQAAHKKGNLSLITSPYTLMNVFIGVMTSIEYGAKGLISLPMKWAYSGVETGTITLLVKDHKNEITEHSYDGIKVLKQYPETSLKLIEAPRYKQFLNIMISLADTDITILEIAGNTNIQCKIRYNKNAKKVSQELNCVKSLYSWNLQTQPHVTYEAVDVTVTALKEFMRYCLLNDIEILYIHDF